MDSEFHLKIILIPYLAEVSSLSDFPTAIHGYIASKQVYSSFRVHAFANILNQVRLLDQIRFWNNNNCAPN